jgi:hypothetical protein
MAGAGSATRTRRSRHDLLGVNLNDHLAGATGALELARRVASSHQERGADAAVQRLAVEVAQDRAALQDIMGAHSASRSAATRSTPRGSARRPPRLKLNGYLLARSPLSGLEELEMLRLSVESKAAGWRTLRALAETDHRLDPHRLDELISGAGVRRIFWMSSVCVPQVKSSAWGRQLVTHQRHRRGIIFGVHGGLADDAAQAGGGGTRQYDR